MLLARDRSVIALSLLLWPFVSAQNGAPESTTQCSPTIENFRKDGVTLNATGTIPLSVLGQGDWQISRGIEFRLARNTSTVRDVSSWANQYVFLSVPESLLSRNTSSNAQICYYEMSPVNATSSIGEDGVDGNSCNGILSDECQEALRRAPIPIDGSCPRIDAGDACERSIRIWKTSPFNFSQPDCMLSSVPAVDLPDKYRSMDVLYHGLPFPVAEEDFFSEYDLLVRQTVPMIFTAIDPSKDITGSVEVVCLAADTIAPGSREPEGEFPPNNANLLAVNKSAVMIGLLGLIVSLRAAI